jgi:hypothetical protein
MNNIQFWIVVFILVVVALLAIKWREIWQQMTCKHHFPDGSSSFRANDAYGVTATCTLCGISTDG